MFGADAIIKAVFSALGLDPDTTRAQLVTLQNWIVTSLKNMDSRLRATESDREVMHAKLDLILKSLGQQYEPAILEKDEHGTNNQSNADGRDEQSTAIVHSIADGRGDARNGTSG